MLLVALLLQSQPAPVTRASTAPPQSFSILQTACPPAQGNDVVVCANGTSSQKLPLPDEAEPSPNYVKPDSGDYRDNRGGGGSCATRMGGCQVGFGPPIVPMVAAAVKGVKNALKDRREGQARRRDGDRRVPIALTGDGPIGRLEP